MTALMLETYTFGEPKAKPPLLIAHGLFGSGRNWGVIARRLAEERHVVTVDMRNHAQSPWYDTHSYADLAADLAEVIARYGGQADVLGHSMGGKAAMVLALTWPDRVRKLVVADIAPVAYAHSQMGPIEAMRGVDLATVEARADAADQMVGIEEELKPFLLQSLDLKERRWRLNLDVLAREMGKITGFPDIGGQFAGKTFFLAGADSHYVGQEHRERIRALFPDVVHARLKGAGHWLHAEKPREFEAAVRSFLRG